jgi:hypothetical protein
MDHRLAPHESRPWARIDATRALLEDVAWPIDHEPASSPELVAAASRGMLRCKSSGGARRWH